VPSYQGVEMTDLTETLPRHLIKADFALYEDGNSFCLHHNHNHRRNTLIATFPVGTTSVLKIANIAEQHLEACTPKINTVVSANEIGKAGCSRYIFHTCDVCGKPRWIRIKKGKPRHSKCKSCSHLKGMSYRNSNGYVHVRVPHNSPKTTSQKGGIRLPPFR